MPRVKIPLKPVEFRKRECGECTMCCRLMAVRELQKPATQWCAHVKQGRGCGIYETRPESCRAFECLWLASPFAPDALRPDRIKGLMSLSTDGKQNIILHEDPGYPGLALAALKPLLDRYVSDGSHYYVVISGQRRLRTYFGNPIWKAEAIAMLDETLPENQL